MISFTVAVQMNGLGFWFQAPRNSSMACISSGTLSYSWDATAAAGPVAFSANDSSGAGSTTIAFPTPGS